MDPWARNMVVLSPTSDGHAPLSSMLSCTVRLPLYTARRVLLLAADVVMTPLPLLLVNVMVWLPAAF